MTNLQKITTFILLTASLCSCKHRPENTVVPHDWLAGAEGDPTMAAKLEQSVDHAFNLHAKILDDAARTNADWSLGGMVFDLAVSVEGALGVLVGEGEVAVRTAWVRADQPQGLKLENSSPIKTLELKADDSEEAFAKNVFFLQEMALSTGLIKSPTALRNNLKSALLQFRNTGRLLNESELEKAGWRLSEYVQVLSISGEGEVGTVVVGGLVTFKMVWKIEARHHEQALKNFSTLRRVPKNISLELLLSGLASDLENVTRETEAIEESGYELEKFYVEIGAKGEGEFGVVSGSIKSAGKIVFSRNDDDDDGDEIDRDFQNARHSTELANLRSKIFDFPSASTLMLLSASPNGVSLLSKNGDVKSERVDRAVFRRGLKRALRMGRFFARRAARVQSRDWKIKEIETEFELAVNGTVGVATVEGFAALSLEFERKDSK